MNKGKKQRKQNEKKERNGRLDIRLSVSEKAAVQRKANACDLSVSEYVRKRAHDSGLLTMKEMLESDMCACIDLACDVPHFYSIMENLGYEVSFRSKYPSFLPIGAKRPLRLK